jgi:uncharacterized protein YuzE
MRILVDEKTDALYVYFSDARPAKTLFVDEDNATLIDLGENGELLGIEVIYRRRVWTDQLTQILREHSVEAADASELRMMAAENRTV